MPSSYRREGPWARPRSATARTGSRCRGLSSTGWSRQARGWWAPWPQPRRPPGIRVSARDWDRQKAGAAAKTKRSSSTYGVMIEGANECVTVAIFRCGHGGLGLDHGIDAPNWTRPLARLPLFCLRCLAQKIRANIPLCATSVATSKSTWFLTSRWSRSASSLAIAKACCRLTTL